MRWLPFVVALSATASTGAAASEARSGDRVAISIDRESEMHGDGPFGMNGSTSDHDTYVERVVAVRDDGAVLDYDVSADTDPGERASDWHLPARVLKAPDGTLRLLNAAELEKRVDPWLRSANMTRAACGRLIFTWNAFRIDCDPQTVVEGLAKLQLPDRLAAGTPASDPDARAAAPLTRTAAGGFTATLPVDPDTIRRRRAQEDATVAEISGKTLSTAAALRAHADEAITGTITLDFDVDGEGRTRRRVRREVTRIASPHGNAETTTVTETLTRTPLPPG